MEFSGQAGEAMYIQAVSCIFRLSRPRCLWPLAHIFIILRSI